MDAFYSLRRGSNDVLLGEVGLGGEGPSGYSYFCRLLVLRFSTRERRLHVWFAGSILVGVVFGL